VFLLFWKSLCSPCQPVTYCSDLSPGHTRMKVDGSWQRRIFIFSFGGVDKYLGGGAAACFGRGAMATPGKAKENV
jgi:hypothetical protein